MKNESIKSESMSKRTGCELNYSHYFSFTTFFSTLFLGRAIGKTIHFSPAILFGLSSFILVGHSHPLCRMRPQRSERVSEIDTVSLCRVSSIVFRSVWFSSAIVTQSSLFVRSSFICSTIICAHAELNGSKERPSNECDVRHSNFEIAIIIGGC